MQTLSLYLVTAAVFLVVDALMLTNVMKPLFERHLGDALRESPALAPAAIFYLFYVAGVVFLASLPALAEGDPLKALWMGGLLGAMAYGTYEFTNLATLKNWSWQMVAVDFTWGIVLTGVSAFVGVWTVLRLSA